jgi:hypothetical protein
VGSCAGLNSNWRFILAFWRLSYRYLPQCPAGRIVAEVGMHAVLSGLRAWRKPSELMLCYFDRYAARADLVLLQSLDLHRTEAQPQRADFEALLLVRDAAFWVRWCELRGERP